MLTLLINYLCVPIIFTIVTAIFTKHKRWLGLVVLLPLIIAMGLLIYFALPSRNLLSLLAANGLFGIFWLCLYLMLTYMVNSTDKQFKKLRKTRSKLFIFFIGITASLLIVAFGGYIHSYMSVKPTWNSIDKTYSKSTQAPTFKRGETPVALAPKTVLNRVRKASSDIPNTQYFQVSNNVQAQYYKGRPIYVVPIEYGGFLKMWSAKEIPGYFIIDATKQDATPQFVRKPYKYATSAYFNKDAERRIYLNNPNWLSLASPQLEIDDNGTPYWIETLYKSEPLSHRVNYRKLHVAVMNAQTGEVKRYDIHNLPKFVDEGITTDIANKINKTFGKYKYGFWNWSKREVMKPTGNGVEDGVTSVFNSDGSISYFTDFTTDRTGSDSALGYSMINARNGKLTFYRAKNIMDSDGAKKNAEQNYKAQKWQPNMPILYNVNGHPTWVMTILDSTSAIRGYYYLDASNQAAYGTGSTPTSALDDFRQALVNSNEAVGNTPGVSKKKVKGTVDRVAVLSAQNKVLITLKGEKTIYTINLSDYSSASLVKSSDKVSFSANVVNGKSVGNVSNWKNENLN